MNKIHEWINTVGIIAIFILVLVGGNQSGQNTFSATGTRFPNGLAVGSTASTTQNKLTIGNTGIPIGKAIFGTCNLDINSGWLNATNASNTIRATCPVTNVQSGDHVWVQLPEHSPGLTTKSGFWVVSSHASSTGVIGITLFNGTGAATSSFPLATTSVRYWILR